MLNNQVDEVRLEIFAELFSLPGTIAIMEALASFICVKHKTDYSFVDYSASGSSDCPDSDEQAATHQQRHDQERMCYESKPISAPPCIVAALRARVHAALSSANPCPPLSLSSSAFPASSSFLARGP